MENEVNEKHSSNFSPNNSPKDYFNYLGYKDNDKIGICFLPQNKKILLNHLGNDSTTWIFLYFSVQEIWIINDFKSTSAIIVKILISALGSFFSSCWSKSLKTSNAPPGNNQQCTAAIFILWSVGIIGRFARDEKVKLIYVHYFRYNLLKYK